MIVKNCPTCGSIDLDIMLDDWGSGLQEIEIDNNSIRLKRGCCECGSVWIEIHNIEITNTEITAVEDNSGG
jgi:ribosomal protein S27AE